ncbi:MAG: acetate kinase, partial [Cyanobacteria bacterium J06632_22]
MNILVLNAGSSSHKLCCYAIPDGLIDGPTAPLAPLWAAQLDWHPKQERVDINIEASHLTYQTHHAIATRQERLASVIQTLWDGPTAVLSSAKEIDAVGHRVVHGGTDYQQSVVITAAVKATIDRLSEWAPVHNPINLEGIELMEQVLPDVPQVAVFDTAFHSQMSVVAATYPGPYAWFEQGIRRYGFHGISHQYCAQRAAQLLNRPLAELRLVICHLGNGSSLSAVKQGHSIDTTMGFTPLDGLMMGTRSGAVDPGILVHLMRQGQSADEIDQLLNQESGLKGISGISNDLRVIKRAIEDGNPRASLARDLYLHRLKACLGSMIMSLEGLDALIFTAGIGEHSPELRAAVCSSMAYLGIALDEKK